MTTTTFAQRDRSDWETLPTPALVIDVERVDRNIARMAAYARQHGLGLRPHIKTHKSLEFARRQLAAGAIGLTVAKCGEAEVMRSVCGDLLLAYPTVDQARTDRLAALAHEITVRVAVDTLLAVERLADSARRAGVSIGVLVDLDVGFHRTGVQGVTAATRLAQAIERTPGVTLAGLFIYPGHVTGPAARQRELLDEVDHQVRETLETWTGQGLAAEIVSGGTTPSAHQAHHVRQLTEIRPGTYIFNDMNIVRGGYATLDDCAARIVCTVVSDAVPGKVILDAGSKTLTSDPCGPAPETGHGYLVDYPAARIGRLTEEHAEVDITACGTPPRLGERVTVIPNHICPCVNLQNAVWLRSSAASAELTRWPVDARGLLS